MPCRTGLATGSCVNIRSGHEADRAPGRTSAGNLAHRARCLPGKTRPSRSRGGKRGSPCPVGKGVPLGGRPHVCSRVDGRNAAVGSLPAGRGGCRVARRHDPSGTGTARARGRLVSCPAWGEHPHRHGAQPRRTPRIPAGERPCPPRAARATAPAGTSLVACCRR